jgi:hypothetical protein
MADRWTVEGVLDELRASHNASATFAPLHATIQDQLPPALGAATSLGTVVASVEDSVSSVLAVPLADVLAGAWSRLDEVLQLRGPAGGRGQVALASHTVTGDYRPRVTVRVSAPVVWSQSWDFDLRIELGLEALTLNIDAGKIRTISPCRAKLSVTLLWKDYELLKVVDAGPVDLLGHVRLGDGLTIP